MPEPRKPRDRSAPGGLSRAGGHDKPSGLNRFTRPSVPGAAPPRASSAGASAAPPGLPEELLEDDGGSERAPRRPPAPTPRWWVPSMLGLMIAGLLWIVVFYLSGSVQLPVPALGAWNLGVGFALIIAGFVMTTRWR